MFTCRARVSQGSTWTLLLPTRLLLCRVSCATCSFLLQQLAHANQPQADHEFIFNTMATLSALDPHDNMGKRYEVFTTVWEIAPGQPLWYMSCNKCRKAVRKEGSSYRCFECTEILPVPRFRITLIGTGEPEPADGKPPAAEYRLQQNLLSLLKQQKSW